MTLPQLCILKSPRSHNECPNPSKILNICTFLPNRVTRKGAKGNEFLHNLGTKANLVKEFGTFHKQMEMEGTVYFYLPSSYRRMEYWHSLDK